MERRYDMDWLRVLAILTVFVFHCSRFFGGGTWHINNQEDNIVAWLFIGWLDMWLMPLFFLLSGAGTWFALQHKSIGKYIVDRSKRILIPLYTVGLFIILPPQYYFELVSNANYQGTFSQMLPRYFSDLGIINLEWPGNLLPFPFSGHLWFLLFLFLISMTTLPILRYIRSEKGLRFIDIMAGLCNRYGGVLLFLFPLIIVRIGLRSFFEGGHNWADFVEFELLFIIGFLIPADIRFSESIKKHSWVCLLLAVICFMIEGYFVMEKGYRYPQGEPFSSAFIVFETVFSIGRLSWIVFAMSLGMKYMNVNNKVLAYSNEAVLPFYILHQTIILGVGWFVIPWDAGILQKFMIITVLSFMLIMVIYELLIRRLNTLRFLFGMRLRKKFLITKVH